MQTLRAGKGSAIASDQFLSLGLELQERLPHLWTAAPRAPPDLWELTF